MNFILFIHQDSPKTGKMLKKILDKNCKGGEIKLLQTFNSFKTKLKQFPNYEDEVFILFADSNNRLIELTSLIDLLENKRIVLIIPDDSEETVSIALQFFPRYFTFISDTYHDLCDVLNKMIDNENLIKN